MLSDLFDEFMFLSKKLREEYPKSLGEKVDNWEEILQLLDNDIPMLYQVIYSKVSGTHRDIKQQELMDFIPGYRLIHINELNHEVVTLKSIYKDYDAKVKKVTPLLTNYSSDFICHCKMIDGTENVASITHDDPKLTLMHVSSEKFLETLCEFYKSNVYYLDSDGYLDYDFEKEGEIGAKINKNIDYWSN